TKKIILIERILAEKKLKEKKKKSKGKIKEEGENEEGEGDFFTLSERVKPLRRNIRNNLNRITHLSNKHPFFQINNKMSIPFAMDNDEMLNIIVKKGIEDKYKMQYKLLADDAPSYWAK
ncbi:MAG: hypothetical protein MJ252_21755, partial [archaeon]|nr:hypothetical protein [archaeon]